MCQAPAQSWFSIEDHSSTDWVLREFTAWGLEHLEKWMHDDKRR